MVAVQWLWWKFENSGIPNGKKSGSRQEQGMISCRVVTLQRTMNTFTDGSMMRLRTVHGSKQSKAC